MVNVSSESASLLVKPDVARRQLEAEVKPVVPPGEQGAGPSGGAQGPATSPDDAGTTNTPVTPAKLPRRFHGSVRLDTARVGRDAGKIAEEVIAHLSGLVGADVVVTMEVEAQIPSGVPENVVRTVTENSRTLKFTTQGFESE